MASFMDLMIKARNRTKAEGSGERFVEILGILRKHEIQKGITPQGMVDLLQDLGTTFVKLGQIASTHADMLPAEYCDALGQLRTQASPLPFDTVKAQVEAELGAPLDELFAEFDPVAVGSASIAQVHRAVLPDGTQVACKVQRPGVVEQVTDDLAIMEHLVELYDFVSRGEAGLSLKELVDELVRTSKEELDFHVEASNLERFFANNEAREGVTSPRCYRELTTNAVLTEDFAESPAVERIDELGLDDQTRDQLAYLVANNYMQQMMEDGFFHADPHAGNVLVTEGGAGIEWIDFGMMGVMSKRERAVLSELVWALLRGDAYGLKRAVLKVATPRGQVDHAALLDACEQLAGQFADLDLESFDTGAMMSGITDMLQGSGYDLDPFLVTLGRGLVTLEGTIKLISPRLAIMTVLAQYVRSSFDPQELKGRMQHLMGRGIDSARATVELPSKAVDTLDMLQKGQLKVGMDLGVNDRFATGVRVGLIYLALAILAGAIIVGSCIYSLADHALLGGVVSVPGAAGLASGLALTVYIVVKSRTYLK